MEEIDKEAIKIAIKESMINKENNYKKGGPFGACIVKNGEIIATAHNLVIENNDPTAHAEINCIRKAAKTLNTYDLTDCTLYTSTEPCPMCLSAIIWANIKEVYYCNTKDDANEIGFRDDIIYEYLKGNKNNIIKLNHVENKEAKKVFEEFKKIQEKNIY